VIRFQVARRALALAAVAAAATAAVLAVSAPASAHKSDIEGTFVCDQQSGDWVVTWTVRNDMRDVAATLKDVVVTPEGTTVSGIAEGTALPAGGSVTGVQRVSGEETSASLSLLTKWVNGRKFHAEGKVKFEGKCEKPEQPTPTPTATPTAPASPPGEATPTPTATPAPGAGGGLPVTGSAVGGTVAAAAALLVLGLGLFLVARRRRIRFTA
jgi:LPXTG-motif cell wall-anchored protein